MKSFERQIEYMKTLDQRETLVKSFIKKEERNEKR